MTTVQSSPPTTHLQLYETDFVQWVDRAAVLLRAKRFDDLDLENLIKEVEGLGRRDKRELQNRLSELLLHLLKWHCQPQRRAYPHTENEWNQDSWARSIIFQRRAIKRLLRDSPSLKNLASESLDECYKDARKGAESETRLTIAQFPLACN